MVPIRILDIDDGLDHAGILGERRIRLALVDEIGIGGHGIPAEIIFAVVLEIGMQDQAQEAHLILLVHAHRPEKNGLHPHAVLFRDQGNLRHMLLEHQEGFVRHARHFRDAGGPIEDQTRKGVLEIDLRLDRRGAEQHGP